MRPIVSSMDLANDNKTLINGYFTSTSVDDKTYAGIGDNGSTTAKDGDVTVRSDRIRQS